MKNLVERTCGRTDMRIRAGMRTQPTQTLRMIACPRGVSATRGAVLQSTSLYRLGTLDNRNFGAMSEIANWIVGDVIEKKVIVAVVVW